MKNPMKHWNKAAVFGLGAIGILGLGQSRGDGMGQIHPGYDIMDIQPLGKQFLVGGIDFFSDGRMAVCTWGNPGEVWVVKGAADGNKATVQPQRYAYGLQQVLGCKVVEDTLYVMQMGELTQLVDTDGDGRADQYNKINDAFATSESLLGYAFDVLYFGGSFYATLSADVGWQGMTFKPPLKDRSCFIRMGRDNSVEYLAAGFRNPNGMGLAFGNKMFATDNQGSWLPSSKLIYLEKGKFYGHRTDPPNRFQDQPESPPVAWLPYGDVDFNPGNVQFIPEGLFKNQLFLAEEDKRIGGRIYRVSIQDVGGVLQGAILPFTGGLGTGISRVAMGKGNILYAGALGADGNWYGLETMVAGLKRLKPKDITKSYAFEMLAVRSTGPSTIELEFTGPPAADAVDPAKYAVETWNHIPEETYGGGNKKNQHNLTVQAATLKPDGKTVELKIAGLLENYLVHIKLVGLLSADGQAAWGKETWFTLNKFGPGKVPDVAGCMDPQSPSFDAYAAVSDPAACASSAIRHALPSHGQAPMMKSGKNLVHLDLPANAPYAMDLYDMRGVRHGAWVGMGASEINLASRRNLSGLFLLKLRTATHTWSQIWLLEP